VPTVPMAKKAGRWASWSVERGAAFAPPGPSLADAYWPRASSSAYAAVKAWLCCLCSAVP